MGSTVSVKEQRQRQLRNLARQNENADRESRRALERERLEIQRIIANKPKPFKVYTGNRTRIQEALNSYKNCAADQGNYRQKAIDDKAVSTAVIAKYKVKRTAIQKILSEFNKEQKLKGVKIEVREFREKFENNDKEVNAVIEKTCVNRTHIADFLRLTANIVPTVIQGVQQSNNLNSCFETFHNLISRECTDHLSIDVYFANKGLERFLPALEQEQLYTLQDLECEDEEEYEEDILTVYQDAINVAKEQKEEDGKENDLAVDLKRIERKKLKKISMKPENWKKAQREKSALNKRILKQSAPPIIKFFDRIYCVMSQVGKLLEIGYEYNAQQQLALQGKNSPRAALMAPKINNNCNGSGNSNVQDQDLKTEDVEDCSPTKCVMVPVHNSQLSRLNNENMIIGEFAVASVNVVESMEEDFANSEIAKTFAYNIEETCEKIIRAQSNLRRNVALAMEIAKLKPGNLTPDAKKLWDSVDRGCAQIYSTTIDMIEVSAQYFGFFLRFKDSFVRYMQANADDENCSFACSLMYLQKDLREFLDFKNNYGQRLTMLNDTAMKCIADCVSNTFGGKNFESAHKNWKRSQELYLDALERLQMAELAIDEEYLKLKNKESIILAEIEKHEFLWKTADDIIDRINKRQTNWDEQIRKLQQQLTTATDYVTHWR